MLMNSFSTSADTLAYLAKYPKLALDATGLPLEFQQNKAPKVTKEGLAPASWPAPSTRSMRTAKKPRRLISPTTTKTGAMNLT